nr:Chain C, Gag protein [synthetic construct]
KGFNPEVIPMF